jgi:hypothetical protein
MKAPGNTRKKPDSGRRQLRPWWKESRMLLFLVLFAALCNSAYGQKAASLPAPRLHFPNVSTEKVSVVPGPLTKRSILSLLFGNYDPKSQSSKWPATAPCQDPFGSHPECTTIVVRVHHYRVSGAERVLVLLATPPPAPGEDCHACAPVVGDAIFAPAGSNWQLVSDNPSIGSFGEYGKVGKYEIVRIGQGSVGVVFLPEGTGQGFLTQSMQVFAELDGKLTHVLTVDDIAGNNEGACSGAPFNQPCWAYRSTYAFKASPSSSLYDLLVTTKGTEFVAGAVARIDKTVCWSFDGTTYVLQK